MRVFSYVVEHDVGFAPNPFHRICTLAACKPRIRKVAKPGDIIIGTGAREAAGRLIYWAMIDEVITIDQYWNDDRYKNKKVVMNGSKMQQYGDNIYYHSKLGEVMHTDSFHSDINGGESPENKKRDTGTTKNVLISKDFLYLGHEAKKIPKDLSHFVKKGPSHKSCFAKEDIEEMVRWLRSNNRSGMVGRPMHW